ncbi:uncharacterized protein LOC129685988 [Psammomys obesus]|uniref:uncharacterized protein LOC129685988 n=1 Tax=Psammomys obesus TaxID=48139 RepID=UPI00245280A7|nr:uncharacterized protein LOC129685988 [Psammomys obesus]
MPTHTFKCVEISLLKHGHSPLNGSGSLQAQAERTRTAKGPASGAEERGENAGPGHRGLGLCSSGRRVPPTGCRGLSPAAARSRHRGGFGDTVSPRSHLPPPSLETRGLRSQASKGSHGASARGTKDGAGGRGGVRPRPPPGFASTRGQGLRAQKLPSARTPRPRGPAVRRPVTCAQPGDAGPGPGDPRRLLPHRGRSPSRVPRHPRSPVRGLSRPAPGAWGPPRRRGRVRGRGAPRKWRGSPRRDPAPTCW